MVGKLHEVSPAAAAPAPGERQQGRQASGVFLERLDAQQLNAGSGRADGRRFTHSSDRTLRTLRSKPWYRTHATQSHGSAGVQASL